jgi:preprotein translocase subunit SecF
MELILFIIVIIGTLFAIASGVWVATALIKAISTKKQTNDKNSESRDTAE